jgi:hypothetical protein
MERIKVFNLLNNTNNDIVKDIDIKKIFNLNNSTFYIDLTIDTPKNDIVNQKNDNTQKDLSLKKIINIKENKENVKDLKKKKFNRFCQECGCVGTFTHTCTRVGHKKTCFKCKKVHKKFLYKMCN